MKNNTGTINPGLIFWIKLGAGMYIALQLIGLLFRAAGVI